MKLFKCLSLSFFVFAFAVDMYADWSPPINLYSSQTISAPVVGVDSSKNATFIVSANDGSSYFEKTGQLINGVVSNLNSYSQIPGDTFQSNQNIAVSPPGNAVVAWLEADSGGNNFIRSALFLNNVWQNPTSLSDASTLVDSSTNPGLNISSANEALVVWISLSTLSGTQQVEWNLYANGVWTNPGTPIIQNNDFLNDLKLSGNANGQAFALWVDESPSVLQGAVFDGATWILNPSIATDVFVGCLPPIDVSMNVTGDALLVWANTQGGVSALTYTNGIYGIEQFPAPNSTSSITGVATAFSDNGDGVVVWTAVDTTGTLYTVSANRYRDGAWSNIVTVLDSATGGATNTSTPNVKIDRFGNALAVWNRVDSVGNSQIYYAISDASSNEAAGTNVWSNLASQISTDSTSVSPNLSMNSSGVATVVWSISDSGPQTAQASYLATPLFAPQPAQTFQGAQHKNRLPWQIEFVNILKWNESPSPDVAFYSLFRNGVQIATINHTAPLRYDDRDRKKGVGTTYELVTTNTSGLQSAPLTVFIP